MSTKKKTAKKKTAQPAAPTPKQGRVAKAQRQLEARRADLALLAEQVKALEREANERRKEDTDNRLNDGWTATAIERRNSLAQEMDPIRAEIMRIEGQLHAEENTPDLADVEEMVLDLRNSSPLGKAVRTAEAELAKLREEAERIEKEGAAAERELTAPAGPANLFLAQGDAEGSAADVEELQARCADLRARVAAARDRLAPAEARLKAAKARLRNALARCLAEQAKAKFAAHCKSLQDCQERLRAAHKAVRGAAAPAAEAARLRREYEHLLTIIRNEVGEIGPPEPMEEALRQAHRLELVPSFQDNRTRWFLAPLRAAHGFFDHDRHLIAAPISADP